MCAKIILFNILQHKFFKEISNYSNEFQKTITIYLFQCNLRFQIFFFILYLILKK
jgi:hypothetical protein